jgi:FkbM family methyltransferase
MRYIRLKIKKIASSIGLKNFAVETWFKYLGLKNAIRISFLEKTIVLSKEKKKIIISRGSNVYGSTGIVVRDFDDFFNTIVTIKNNDGIEIIDFSTPQYHTLIKNNDKFFFHDICEPGAVTDIYVDMSKLKEGDVVLDIGCYCGTQTVYFSKLVGESGLVLAFEPDGSSFESLSLNLKNHHCDNTIKCNFGLFSHDGQIGFSNDGGMGASVSIGSNHSITVKKLSTVCEENNLSKIDFIKMDIEGSEIDVLNSSFDIIKKFKPRFIIEPHFKNGILNDKEILKIFQTLNYETKIL